MQGRGIKASRQIPAATISVQKDIFWTLFEAVDGVDK
jgi:hypothetical protein